MSDLVHLVCIDGSDLATRSSSAALRGKLEEWNDMGLCLQQRRRFYWLTAARIMPDGDSGAGISELKHGCTTIGLCGG
ncbi:hypothetical protein M0R45_035252 [Rubus argutus]|uniref:MHC class I antigen n=1 Tax=Rubus argutus TaxID=59490 RepID=A0AAW1VXX4_RUBAR